MTPLEQFQSTHVNHLGRPLSVDNVLGPQTRWALWMDDQVRARRLMWERAHPLIGIKESPMGSNRGPEIDMWMRRCGIYVPQDPTVVMPQNAWCAALASWVLSAGLDKPVAIARVANLIKLFPVIPLDAVLPMDLGYFLRDDDGDGEKDDSGHVWFVTGRDGERTMNLEGNTNNAVRVTMRAKAQYVRTVPLAGMPGIPTNPPIPWAGSATR